MENLHLRIKQQRKKVGITLRDLAAKVGVSASFLSQIEKDKTSLSLQSLIKIANALHTTIGHLIGETEVKTVNTPVIGEKDRKSFKRIGKGVELQFLSSMDRNHVMEPCLHKLEKGVKYGDPSFQHYGQELVLVLSGDIEIELNNDIYKMKKEDSIYFDSNMRHSFRNIGKKVAKFLCVSSPSHV